MACPMLLVLACVCALSAWTELHVGSKTLLLDSRCQPLPTALLGPFVTLGDGSVLAVDDQRR